MLYKNDIGRYFCNIASSVTSEVGCFGKDSLSCFEWTQLLRVTASP